VLPSRGPEAVEGGRGEGSRHHRLYDGTRWRLGQDQVESRSFEREQGQRPDWSVRLSRRSPSRRKDSQGNVEIYKCISTPSLSLHLPSPLAPLSIHLLLSRNPSSSTPIVALPTSSNRNLLPPLTANISACISHTCFPPSFRLLVGTTLLPAPRDISSGWRGWDGWKRKRAARGVHSRVQEGSVRIWGWWEEGREP
jgi:hypothetical protein